MHFVMGKINDEKSVYLLKQIRKAIKSNFGHFMLSLVFIGGKGEVPQISAFELFK